MTTATSVHPLHVTILRPPFTGDFFTLVLDNGQSEELEVEETREWFRVRGANMDVVEKALDEAWNFAESGITIKNPKVPRVLHSAIQPKL